jgi:hypothetical protein
MSEAECVASEEAQQEKQDEGGLLAFIACAWRGHQAPILSPLDKGTHGST